MYHPTMPKGSTRRSEDPNDGTRLVTRHPFRARFAMLGLALLAVAGPASGERRPRTLTVFAAASLTGAFQDIARAIERDRPDLEVRLVFAGSNQLALQLEHGARADVFASADSIWMGYARARRLVAETPRVFARNRLVAIVPRTNPARIVALPDLAKPGVKLVLAAEAVPAGRYAREALRNLARMTGFGDRFAARALANLVSEEENVRAVVSRVQLGEADAGLCYRSDVTGPSARYLRVFEIPAAANVSASYPIAALAASRQGEAARAFVDRVLSAEGQAILARYGFEPR